MTDKPLPYPENPGQTHWQGCFRYPKHHNCAVREVDKLREGIDSILRHLIAAGPIPEREKWLWESQRALTSLLRGMEDAAAGRLTDGPNLEADGELIEDMGIKQTISRLRSQIAIKDVDIEQKDQRVKGLEFAINALINRIDGIQAMYVRGDSIIARALKLATDVARKTME